MIAVNSAKKLPAALKVNFQLQVVIFRYIYNKKTDFKTAVFQKKVSSLEPTDFGSVLHCSYLLFTLISLRDWGKESIEVRKGQ